MTTCQGHLCPSSAWFCIGKKLEIQAVLLLWADNCLWADELQLFRLLWPAEHPLPDPALLSHSALLSEEIRLSFKQTWAELQVSLSQLLIYAVSVLSGVKSIRHVEASPHFCSNLKEHLRHTGWVSLPTVIRIMVQGRTQLQEKGGRSQRLGWSKGLTHRFPSLAQTVISGSCSWVINSQENKSLCSR